MRSNQRCASCCMPREVTAHHTYLISLASFEMRLVCDNLESVTWTSRTRRSGRILGVSPATCMLSTTITTSSVLFRRPYSEDARDGSTCAWPPGNEGTPCILESQATDRYLWPEACQNQNAALPQLSRASGVSDACLTRIRYDKREGRHP